MTIDFDRDTREMYESDYARTFNEENKHWAHQPEYNGTFLRVQIAYLNDLLAARGHVFLNEVYDALGFPRVPQGQLIGWFYADGRSLIPRYTPNDDGSLTLELNVTNSDVMYFKIF